MKTFLRYFTSAVAGLVLLLNGGGCASLSLQDVQQTHNPKTLARNALKNPDPLVRLAAVQRINDDAVLASLLLKDQRAEDRAGVEVRLQMLQYHGFWDAVLRSESNLQTYTSKEIFDPAYFAYERVDKKRPLLSFEEVDWPVAAAALERIKSQQTFANLLVKFPTSNLTVTNPGKSDYTKAAATIHRRTRVIAWVMEKLVDQTMLAQVAARARRVDVREAAFAKITDEAIVTDIARNPRYDARIRQFAVMKLTSRETVADMALYEVDLEVRQTAKARLQALDSQPQQP